MISGDPRQTGQGCRDQDRCQDPTCPDQSAAAGNDPLHGIIAETTGGFGHLIADATARLGKPG